MATIEELMEEQDFGRIGVRSPGRIEGVSSVAAAPQGARLSRGLTTLQTPVDRARATAEQAGSPLLSQELRSSLAELQRYRSAARRPGTRGPLARREERRGREAAQTSVLAALQDLQGVRSAAVADRQTNAGLLGAIEDRQMQEAGAFDRALLGLEGLEVDAAARLGVAETAARDPYAESVLQLASTMVEDDPLQVGPVMNVLRGTGAWAPPAATDYGTYEGRDVTVPISDREQQIWLMGQQMDPAVRTQFYATQGYHIDRTGAFVPLPARRTADTEATEGQAPSVVDAFTPVVEDDAPAGQRVRNPQAPVGDLRDLLALLRSGGGA